MKDLTGMPAIATTRDESDLQQRADRFLSKASFSLACSLELEETLQTVARLCVPTLGDWLLLDLIDQDATVHRVKVAAAAEADSVLAQQLALYPPQANQPRQLPSHAQPTHVLFGGDACAVAEITETMLRDAAQSETHAMLMQAVSPKSKIVVPLVARGSRIGALTLLSTRSGRRYGNRELRLIKRLAPRVAIAIDNARLFQAAQQASAAKSKYVANMSHEIRSPMTAVLGYTDLLTDRENDPEKLEFLSTIKRNGHFLLNIINDILDLSKIEAGKMEMVPEPFVLAELIADVQSVMSVRAAEKQLEFSVDVQGNVPHKVLSDAKRLRQILVNLIGNAIKFTETGAVRLKVQYLQDENPPRIRFDVTDSGIGMTKRQQSKLFEAFSQGDTSVTRTFGGSGLGLAISQRFAKMLGGKITVVSRLGKGSTFSCEVATAAVEQYESSPSQADHVSEQTPAAEFPPRQLACRVLVVDDRHDVRFLAQQLLQKSGARVELASDGIEAIERIRDMQAEGQEPDLVMLDMQMPRLDGYQTAARLRRMGFEQPIIAMTADAMDGDSERCLRQGCDDYLSKPVDAAKLFAMVQRYTRDR